MLVWPRGRCGLFSAAILARGHLDAPIRVAITLSASWNAKFFAQKSTALSPRCLLSPVPGQEGAGAQAQATLSLTPLESDTQGGPARGAPPPLST